MLYLLYFCGVVVITTAQLHSAKRELGLFADLNPALGMSEICDCENLTMVAARNMM